MSVGKRGAYPLVHGDLPRQHSFGTTLRLTSPVPADSQQLLLLIHTFSELSLQPKKLRHNKSAIDLSSTNPACGHKEVPRSTGYIVVTSRYSDQQGSKSRQKVMRLYKQWHRSISKRFVKLPYSISRAASIDSDYCRLPTTSFLSNKADKLRSNQF